MRIGIISDIHNNHAALQTVLQEFERRSVDGIVCAGDIIGIGAYPEETVSAFIDMPNLLSAVRGNHDSYLINGLPREFPNTENMGRDERENHMWGHRRISAASRKFIEELPYNDLISVCGKRIYISHYSTDHENRYVNYTPSPALADLELMFKGIEADVIIYGHEHKECVALGDKLYVNCGSLGCPGSELNIARAGVLSINEDVSVELLRVKYDVSKTIEDIQTFAFPAKEEILKYFYGR